MPVPATVQVKPLDFEEIAVVVEEAAHRGDFLRIVEIGDGEEAERRSGAGVRGGKFSSGTGMRTTVERSAMSRRRTIHSDTGTK